MLKIRPKLKSLTLEINHLEHANQLALEHISLVRAIVFSRFSHFNFMADDLISVGYVALIWASRKWEDRGVQQFSSFAYTCIVSDIYKWLRAEKVKWRSLAAGKTDYKFAIEKTTYWDHFSGQSAVEVNALKEYERWLTREALNKLIQMAKLTEKERIAVEMRLNKFDDEAIAKALHVKHASARSVYRHGMKKLRTTALAVNLATRLCA